MTKRAMLKNSGKRAGPVLALGAWVLLALAPGLAIKDPDTPWHIRTGELIARNFREGIFGPPRAEPFSWSFSGRPWQPNGWGFDLLAGGFYSAGGWLGAAVLRALLLAALVWLLWRRTSRSGNGWARGTAVVTVSMLLLSFIDLRPQIVSFILLLVGFELIERLRRGPWALAGSLFGLSALWVNFHGAVLAGVGLLGLALIGAYLPRKRILDLFATSGGLVVGTFLNPYGPLAAWTYAFETRNASVSIEEWQSPSLANPRDLIVFAVGAVVLLWVCSKKRRALTHLRALLPLLGAFLLASDAVRNLPFIALVVVAPLGALLSRPWTGRVVDPRKLVVVVLVAAIAGMSVGGIGGINPSEPRKDSYPVSTAVLLPSGCKLLNEYAFGGYLILTRPDVPVSQDGRNDVYGNEWLLQEENLLNGSQGVEGIEKLGINCLLIRPDRRLVEELEESGRWVKLGEDEVSQAWKKR